ncbi:hypothetical protein MNAN1_001717 [Malassezia nana]|uniref:Letm1 RBD domain-containing protein n=1 Tax=Malassezia nana TaxID=180528 RepID=A0AAF0ER38_9BASI|nr:hypothetical protein MNAN1_001717 [Malassezia nana]
MQEALIRTGILAGHQRWCTDPLRHTPSLPWRSLAPVRVLHHSATRWSSIEPKKEDSKQMTIKERLVQLWNTVKYLFRFYLDGVKQIWRNRAQVKAIQRHVRETQRDYTWEETQMIRTHSSDMLKLPLFLLILVTVEELLPLMVIYTPFLLPSTCILPSQALKIRQRLEVNRETAVQNIQNLLREHKEIQPQSDSLPDALAALPPASLRELTIVYNLSKWGTDGFRRERILNHVRQLQEDDQRLSVAEVLQDGNVNMDLLSNACVQRGLVSASQMKLMLRAWLDYTLASPRPSSLELILLPSFIPALKPDDAPLNSIVEQQEKQSISEKASTVVHEVVEQEKRKEAAKKT